MTAPTRARKPAIPPAPGHAPEVCAECGFGVRLPGSGVCRSCAAVPEGAFVRVLVEIAADLLRREVEAAAASEEGS